MSTTTPSTPHHVLPAIFQPSSSTTTTRSTSSYTAPQLLTQGAEALVYKTTFLHQDGSDTAAAALKYRPPKPYRHPVLDRRLTKQRILAEARVLVRLRREGVCVPGIRAVDWDAGWMLLEWIPGHTIRACLDRYLHAPRPALASLAEDAPSDPDHPPAGSTSATDSASRDAAPELWDLMTRVGRAVGKMHSVGCVHGDLTTSNLMLRPTAPRKATETEREREQEEEEEEEGEEKLAGTVVIIDFGLAAQTLQDEDKAVDLYVLERAFGSTHPAAEPLFREVLRAYGESYRGARVVLRRLEEVRLRGRKKSMIG